MKQFWKTYAWYLLPYILWLFIAGAVILNTNKFDFFVFLKQFHSSWADVFFKLSSFFAEWIGWVVVIIIASLVKIRFAIASLLALVLSGVTTQLLKNFVFNSHLRPSAYLSDLKGIHLVEGVDLHYFNSFPSGHTTSAFAICTLLTLILAKKSFLGFVFFILALIMGYSRIYLTQHFPIDVWVGSIIGFVITVIVFTLSDYTFNKLTKPWAEHNLFSIFTRVA